MFKKKECKKCRRKIDGKYSFCPYCGNQLYHNEEKEDWGMLGKDDIMSQINEIKLPMGFNTIFNSLLKNLNKEIEKTEKDFLNEDKKIKKDGLSISISTFGNGPPKIKVTNLGNSKQTEPKKEISKFKQNIFTKEKVKEFASLPREEPKTNIRRFSNKVVYELEMPKVRSLEDISIIKLENSIEIKAIAKNKAYVKLIPINLPIKNYNLSGGKLTLELGIKN